ncbi:hypothetical protein LOD99_9674 [Oopsacas minuta]|uniref:Peroxisome assembly protein 12 n=1 Tax=Oopsacas minuta TaxID=111878 RepID=A0AAV7KLL8_9METZ|nr:hypothetical protein LOD99_9674 [Oopsacas minuta]
MAEEGAHVNVASSQANRPTIFELIAQDGMQQCLKPAFKFVSRNLTENYPQRLSNLFSYFDEIYLIFDLFLQGHHIATYNASFGEHFYGLQRCFSPNLLDTYLRDTSVTKETVLNIRGKFLSLISLCLVPYIYDKLEQKFLIIQEKESNFEILTSKEENFLKIFRYSSAILQIISIIFKISYLTRKTEFFNFILFLQSLKISRILESDQSDSSLPYFSQFSTRTNLRNFILIPFGAANLIGYSFSHILPFGAFLVKFLQHWYAHHDKGIFEIFKTRLPIPPPPPKAHTDSTKCPICNQDMHNPSVVLPSGWVYCYQCITNQIRSEGKCPCSGLAASIDDVVRIYSGVL